jgi:hypothetical membrane protein
MKASFIIKKVNLSVMNLNSGKIAGFLLFVGVVQIILFQVVCETVYPGYNAGQQAISDLGNWGLAGNFAAVFSVSAVLFGLFIVAGAYFVWKGVRNRLFVSLLALAGVCNIGLGVVAEDVSLSIHGLVYLIMVVSWAVSAILSHRLEKFHFSYVSIGLGLFSLVMFFFSLTVKYVGSSLTFGFGLGGIERLTVYPLWLWTLGLGAYLMGANSTVVPTSKT